MKMRRRRRSDSRKKLLVTVVEVFTERERKRERERERERERVVSSAANPIDSTLYLRALVSKGMSTFKDIFISEGHYKLCVGKFCFC